MSAAHPFLYAAESFVVTSSANASDFPLVRTGVAAALWFDDADHTVVKIAARDFAADVERVTGVQPEVSPSTALPTDARGPVVLIGTLGRSALIDDLVRRGRLDAGAVAGKWETFVITTVREPFPGSRVTHALVVAGSDRRGTAFGVYELSQQIGVSPWYWWADVPPKKSAELFVREGAHRMGPPSVKYRGIFINDEDWGLQPWAAQTFAPEEGGIGPKVYRKVFELLLRLKANTLWPAMHACTKPFNAFPENKQLADDYAIVMGSSHAEPMLRNNVGEWPHDRPTDYNYVTNRDGVLQYWEERVRENGRFENIYTVGMRGIHDSAIQGTKTDAERIRVLEQVFADQRALLAKHVQPEVEQVPQMFCAYKEVLDLYRQGLKVPEDVTIVWPDDNFGYIRNFATPEERATRTGGFGVYYHISYLGRPLAYLWLCTTPPALIWEEMHKAYEHGADRIWIVNVGDIKPAEIGTEFFLQMAWDIDRWNPDNLSDFLVEWATREFGETPAQHIAETMRLYYQLNFQRKPEHLQWWLPREEPRFSPLTVDELRVRDSAFGELFRRVAGYASQPEGAPVDAWNQLIAYPVRGAALANTHFIQRELLSRDFWRSANVDFTLLEAERADAWAGLANLIAGRRSNGRWRGFFRPEPADDQWKSMRVAPWDFRALLTVDPPFEPRQLDAVSSVPDDFSGFGEMKGVVALEAEHFSVKVNRSVSGWRRIPGLGRTGSGSVAIFPSTAPSIDEQKLATDAPRLEYDIRFSTPGEHTMTVNLIPTHPIVAGRGLRFAVGLDDQAPRLVVCERRDGSPEWAQGVLNNTVTATAKISVTTPGAHVLKIYGVDAGVVLDKIVIDCGGLQPSYLGPPETRVAPPAPRN